MACSGKKCNFYSPESTVSSLLASCSLNSSSSFYPNSSVQYKDKLYNSASQALEAYIEDFDLSLVSPKIRTGKICIHNSTPKASQSTPNDSKSSNFNLNVKQDSIASPFRSQVIHDPDLVSLTTDDLLAFPEDGSLPFTRATTFGSVPQSTKWKMKSLKKSTAYPSHQAPSFDIERGLNFKNASNVTGNQNPVTPSSYKDFSKKELILLKAKRALESSAEEITSALKKDGSPCTADVLDAERSWENVPVVFKSPVPVQCDEDENTLQNPKASIFNGFLEDCLNNGCQESTFSGGNHHGPVEALKLMLFNLQAVQQSLTPNRTAEQNEFKKVSCLFPLNLELALHHLSRLKGLVDNTASKEDPKEGCQEEEKEKVA
uniref:Chromosome 18 open reading frame 54 n=1 Tax=Sphenodon punctatus TaxID=8508 RepID=A0A8D0HF76_SPHPU